MRPISYEIISPSKNIKRFNKLSALSSKYANLFQIMERVNEREIISDEKILRIVYDKCDHYNFEETKSNV